MEGLTTYGREAETTVSDAGVRPKSKALRAFMVVALLHFDLL